MDMRIHVRPLPELKPLAQETELQLCAAFVFAVFCAGVLLFYVWHRFRGPQENYKTTRRLLLALFVVPVILLASLIAFRSPWETYRLQSRSQRVEAVYLRNYETVGPGRMETTFITENHLPVGEYIYVRFPWKQQQVIASVRYLYKSFPLDRKKPGQRLTLYYHPEEYTVEAARKGELPSNYALLREGEILDLSRDILNIGWLPCLMILLASYLTRRWVIGHRSVCETNTKATQSDMSTAAD